MTLWYRAVYFNEWMFVVPGVLWFSVRTTGPQKVLDVARTSVPIFMAVKYARDGFLSRSEVTYGAVAVIILNLAMCSADTRSRVVQFNATTYFLSHASVVTWLFGIGLGASSARAWVCAINFVSLVAFLLTLLVAVPYTQAWMCYTTNDPTSFTQGYCPQYTGDYTFSKACSFTKATAHRVTSRCNPREFGEYTPLHDAFGLEGHLAAHALLVSGVLYFSQIVSREPLARLLSCQELAKKTK